MLAEAAVWRSHRTYQLPVVVLRPALVYGPDDQTTLPRLIDYLRSSTAMWDGRQNPTIDPIYVSDVVDCAVAAMTSPAAVGQAYNVAPEREWGVKEFWKTLCHELGIRPPSWTIPTWIVTVAAIVCETLARALGRRQPPTLTRAGVSLFAMDRHYDPAKAMRELGWRPRVQLQEGLRRTVRAMLTAETRQHVAPQAVALPEPQPA
jgi:nucleoside-diphosphate-sugar epimerase